MLLQKQLNAKKYIILLGLCVLAFVPFLRFIITSSTNMGRCIFCEISAGKQPTTVIEFEHDDFVIFKDIKPSSTYHYLAVPKRHVESLKALTKNDIGLGKINFTVPIFENFKHFASNNIPNFHQIKKI